LRNRALAAVLQGADLTTDDLLPSSLRPAKDMKSSDSRAHERSAWAEMVAPLLAASLLAARAAIGAADAGEVANFVNAGLAVRIAAAGHRWFTFDGSYHAWAVIAVDAAIDTAAAPEVIDQLAAAAPVLLRAGAPALCLDLASALSLRGVHRDRAADLCVRAARQATTEAYPARDRLDLIARAADISRRLAPDSIRRSTRQPGSTMTPPGC
jgi:hypothetical protein